LEEIDAPATPSAVPPAERRRGRVEGKAPSSSARRFYLVYWAVWFVLVPFVLAIGLVWALTPPSGIEHGGILGWLEYGVRAQPVPVGIVLFTIFEMSLWAGRHKLPLSHHAYPMVPPGVPAELRQHFDRARALADEAWNILEKNKGDVPAADRQSLEQDLEALEAAMHADPFDEKPFVDALVRADGQVDAKLGQWKKSELREYMESILIAVLVAMTLRVFVVEAFKIPSGSMIPTLQVGDHIFVNKFSYGPQIPFAKKRLFTRMPPARGDVMVFAFPEKPEQDFIKRVIAVPGDELRAKNGHPILNGWTVPSCSVGTYRYTDYPRDNAGQVIGPATPHEGELFVEYLGEESYLTLYDHAQGGMGETQGPYTVKPGEVWVMGDNRHNSHDSRMWFGGQGGGVPFDNIRGRALFVWLSTDDGRVDWTRIGALVMGRPRLPAAMSALEPALTKCLSSRPPVSETTPPSGGR
jgi:signal peptidase I